MKKKKEKKFILNKSVKMLIGATIIGAATCAAVGTAYTIRKNDNNLTVKELESVKYEDTLVKEIKYLAIGDSLTAGFNLDSGVDLRGNLANQKVNGLSYPAFFAQFLQQINPNSLVTFDNLALSGTTVKNWLYLLEPENSTYSQYDKTFLKYANNIDKLTNSPYGKQIIDIFGDFDLASYPAFINKIKEANILSFTLGANDLIQSFNFNYLASVEQSPTSKALIGKKIQSDLKEQLIQIKSNLIKLISKIKQINPNLKINLLGYYKFNNIIIKFFEHLLQNELGIPLDFTSKIIVELNEVIKEAASIEDVNYIDTYNLIDWDENKDYGLDFDIHPSAKGYKKIAQQLIYKLALDPNNEIELPKAEINFLQQDKNYYSRILDLGSNQEITSKINDEIVDKTSEYENNNKQDLAKYKGSASNILLAFLNSGGIAERWVVDFLSQSTDFQPIAKLFSSSDIEDSKEFTKNFLTQLIQSPVLDKILSAFKNYIEDVSAKNNWNTLDFSSIINGITHNFLLEGGIPTFINFALSNKQIFENKKELQATLFQTVFSSSSIQDRILALFSNDESKYDDWRVVFDFDSVKILFNKAIDELLESANEYKDLTSFSDLITTFSKKQTNKNIIVEFAKSFIHDALKQEIFTTLLVNLVDKNLNLNFTEQDKNNIAIALLGLADNIVATKTFSNLVSTITIGLMDGLKEIHSPLNKEELSNVFVATFAQKLQKFFSNKNNLFTLVQDLLTSELSENQVELLAKLAQKVSPLISSLQLSSFYNVNSSNFEVAKIIFDSAKEFLQQNNFDQFNQLFKKALKDFFITNRTHYQNATDFDSFIFQLAANNADEIKTIIYNFIAQQARVEKFNTALTQLLSSFLDHFGYSDKTKSTVSKITTRLLTDFAKQWSQADGNISQLDDNIIVFLVEQFATQMKRYVTSNQEKQASYSEFASTTVTNSSTNSEQSEYLKLKGKLNFDDFLKSFAANIFANQDVFYKFLKSFAKIFDSNNNNSTSITTSELAETIFEILNSRPIVEYFKNTIKFSDSHPTLNKKISDLLEKFIKSEQLRNLLNAGVNFVLNKDHLNRYKTLASLLLAFVEENRELVNDAVAFFVGDPEIAGDLDRIVDELLRINSINLKSENLDTLKTIFKDFIEQTKRSIQFKNEEKAKSQASNGDRAAVEPTQYVYNPFTVGTIISLVTSSFFEQDKQNLNDNINLLLTNLIYDISNIYFEKPEQHKIQIKNLLDLLKDFASTDFFKNILNKKMGEQKGQNLSQLIKEILSSPSTQTFAQKFFELVAKHTKEVIGNQRKNSFEIFALVFKDKEFPKILADFVNGFNENNIAPLIKDSINNLLSVSLKETQIVSLIKWLKLILNNNTDGNVHYYEDSQHSLISKISLIFSKFFEQIGEDKHLDVSILKNEFSSEEFIVNLIKQIASSIKLTTSQEDKENIGQLIIAILNSSIIQNSIDELDLSSVTNFAHVSNAQIAIKSFIKKAIVQPGNATFIANIIDTISKNLSKYNSVNTIAELIKQLIRDNKSIIKEYLWQLVDFAINDDAMAKVFAEVIASQLKLTQYSMTDEDYKKISNFLRAFIDKGDSSQIINKLLDVVVDKLGEINSFDANFFTTLFSSISSKSIFDNFDFVVKISDEFENEKHRSWKQLDGKQGSALFNGKVFADFFDTILTKAPEWNSKNKDANSPILDALNKIPYVGLNLSKIIFGGGVDKAQESQLSAIANIFAQIYFGDSNANITYSNFSQSTQGRTLYRFLLIILLYVYDNQIKKHWTRETAFYNDGGVFKPESASAKIFKALKAALPKGKENFKAQYEKFINDLPGTPIQHSSWWKTTWYDNSNVKLSDMLTMIYYEDEKNRFEGVTRQERLKDQVLQQIRDGFFNTLAEEELKGIK